MLEINGWTFIAIGVILGWILLGVYYFQTLRDLREAESELTDIRNENIFLAKSITEKDKVIQGMSDAYTNLAHYTNDVVNAVKRSTSIKAAKASLIEITSHNFGLDEEVPNVQSED